MNIQKKLSKAVITGSALFSIAVLIGPGLAHATASNSGGAAGTAAVDPTSTSTSPSTKSSTLSATVQQQHLAAIKSKGDAEIARRLTQLNKLGSLITSAKHITSSDSTTLTDEVNTEISGLTTLLSKLNSETTLTAAITDAKNVISEYRVFALVTPKVWLVKTADDQQVVEAKFSTFITKLQSRTSTEKTAGKDVTTIQTELSDMTAKVSDAKTISSAIETTIVPLKPSDYNSDTSILSGDAAKLQTARADNVAAYSDAKEIVAQLVALS